MVRPLADLLLSSLLFVQMTLRTDRSCQGLLGLFMVVFAICALPQYSRYCSTWACHVFETAAHAHISSSAVVQEGSDSI